MFAGRVKIVSYSSSRTSAILKYFCPVPKSHGLAHMQGDRDVYATEGTVTVRFKVSGIYRVLTPNWYYFTPTF